LDLRQLIRQWYDAVLIFDAVHPDEPGFIERLTERSVIVLRASSEAEAQRRADDHCRRAEHEYRNPYGSRVHWRCRSVRGVTPLFDDAIVDGTEVFWELLEGDEPVQ
jgi:hypothetical protein